MDTPPYLENHSAERVRVLSQRTDPHARALIAGLALVERALTRHYRSEASAIRNGELPDRTSDE